MQFSPEALESFYGLGKRRRRKGGGGGAPDPAAQQRALALLDKADQGANRLRDMSAQLAAAGADSSDVDAALADAEAAVDSARPLAEAGDLPGVQQIARKIGSHVSRGQSAFNRIMSRAKSDAARVAAEEQRAAAVVQQEQQRQAQEQQRQAQVQQQEQQRYQSQQAIEQSRLQAEQQRAAMEIQGQQQQAAMQRQMQAQAMQAQQAMLQPPQQYGPQYAQPGQEQLPQAPPGIETGGAVEDQNVLLGGMDGWLGAVTEQQFQSMPRAERERAWSSMGAKERAAVERAQYQRFLSRQGRGGGSGGGGLLSKVFGEGRRLLDEQRGAGASDQPLPVEGPGAGTLIAGAGAAGLLGWLLLRGNKRGKR